MAKKNPRKTPRGRVRAMLRAFSLKSRERAFAMRRDNYSCQVCGIKQTKRKGHEVKVVCHHINGAQLEAIVDMVYEHLLCDPDFLLTLCVECHLNHTESTETA